MARHRNFTIFLALAAAAWGVRSPASAQTPNQPSQGATGAAPATTGSVGAAAAPVPPGAVPATSAAAAPPTAELTLEEAMALSEEEVIEVWAERPDKPFDRDTKLRLTGEELAARGAQDLGSALALLPDVTVREGGRGGLNIDVRGSRKGAVRILLDGVSVSDPYYGTFDVSTIPITDIEQIRVSTAPSSPIDGPGGPGGVVEVHTRDAIGAQLVSARLATDTAPGGSAATTARVALGAHTALRLSMSGAVGARSFSLPMDATIDESRRSATAGSRLEYRRGVRRLALDLGADDRHYVSPPSDEFTNDILLIDRETTVRGQLSFDDTWRGVQVNARAWTDRMARTSRTFRDPALRDETGSEKLRALRLGGQALATKPLSKQARWAASLTFDRDSADVRAASREVSASSMILEAAGDVQLEGRGVLADAAVGLAAPFGIDADPWLEAKVDVRYRPVAAVELAVIAARKGRTPSLRERFDSQTGNESLGPEIANHLELRVTAEPALGRLRGRLELAPYVRRTNGTVRIDPKIGRQMNLGELDVRGIDTNARVGAGDAAELGGGYSYIFATSDLVGDDPLDRLPRHRFDAWARVTPLAKVSVLGHLRYFGRRRDRGEQLGAYTTVEASATAELSDSYLVVLRVDDLLDARPETRSGYASAGRTAQVILQGTWR